MLEFQDIEWLFGLLMLLPLVVLFWLVLKWKQKTTAKFGNQQLVAQLTPAYSATRYQWKIILVLVAIGLLVFSAANLRKPKKGSGKTTAGIDVMIAVDISNSMLAEDEKPTRLGKAKAFIYQLSAQLHQNRIGLVLFAGRAILQMPITADAAALNMFVSNAAPELISNQGTVIGDALQLCNNSLDTKEKKYKAIVLITDGEDHDAKATSITSSLANHGVVLYTIGVGSLGGSPISLSGTNSYKKDLHGKTVVSALNSHLLESLAQSTGGNYFKLDDISTVSAAVAANLNSMEKKAIVSPGGYMDYDVYYFIFLAAALFLLVTDVFISEKKTAFQIRKSLAMVLLMVVGTMGSLCAQTTKQQLQQGNESYKKGEYKTAQTEYEKVLSKNPKNITAAFNHANSLYKQEQYSEAAKQMEQVAAATTDPFVQAKAWYNKGLAEVKQQLMDKALASFKQSLLLNNTDEATRENLQKVMEQLQKKKEKPKAQPQNEGTPPPNEMKKKQADQYLKLLNEEEKRLQKELQQKKKDPSPVNEKDW